MRKKADPAKIHALEVELGLRAATAQESAPSPVPILTRPHGVISGRIHIWLGWLCLISGITMIGVGCVQGEANLIALSGFVSLGLVVAFGSAFIWISGNDLDTFLVAWQVRRLPIAQQIACQRALRIDSFRRDFRKAFGKHYDLFSPEILVERATGLYPAPYAILTYGERQWCVKQDMGGDWQIDTYPLASRPITHFRRSEDLWTFFLDEIAESAA